MPPERRRLVVLLGILGLVLLVAVYRFWPSSGPAPAGSSAARASGRAAGPSAITAPDVHLDALDEDRPQPVDEPQRDLFRFRPKPPSAPPPTRAATAVPGSTAPPGPPALPPIDLRFIGIVEAPQQGQKIAILTDGRGIYKGHEGDIIEGRYRLLRIGVESVEMAYLDGRGRQTIRLSGS
jgi:hypothetical protein